VSFRVRIHVRLFLEANDQSTRPLHGHRKVIHAEEQKEPVAGRTAVGAHERGVVLYPPLMETDQNGSVRVEYLAEI